MQVCEVFGLNIPTCKRESTQRACVVSWAFSTRRILSNTANTIRAFWRVLRLFCHAHGALIWINGFTNSPTREMTWLMRKYLHTPDLKITLTFCVRCNKINLMFQCFAKF